ncbi:MAG: YfhO family protein, partial [Saprospiraceae bacterium]
PAKFRRYQDIIDAYLSKGDEKMLNMLNAKYIISQKEQVVARPGAFGNAWFVNNLNFVNSPDEEIVAINNIDPLQTAVLLEREFPGYVDKNANFTKSGSISLTSYEPNLMTYQSNAEGDQFAVFSEVWYDSGKGWEAYIDGKPVKHVRVDYILRGLKIPAGSHTIEFKFFPKPVLTAINLSFWINNLIGLLFLGIIGWWFYNDYKKSRSEPISIVEPKFIATTSSKATIKSKKARK